MKHGGIRDRLYLRISQMVQDDFKAIDSKFVQFQALLENPTPEQAITHRLIFKNLGDNYKEILESAIDEIKKIRQFYQELYSSPSNLFSQSVILEEYDKVYVHLDKLSQNQMSQEQIIKNINDQNTLFNTSLVMANLIHIGLIIAWTLPIAAGLVLLPFILPVVSISPILGVALAIAASTSIVLSLAQIVEEASAIESTSSITQKEDLELSLFSTMNRLFKPNKDTAAVIEERNSNLDNCHNACPSS
jgi:hypothetical protein